MTQRIKIGMDDNPGIRPWQGSCRLVGPLWVRMEDRIHVA